MGAFSCVNFSRLSVEPLPTFTEGFKEQKLLWNPRRLKYPYFNLLNGTRE
jgi:hypothetical protein